MDGDAQHDERLLPVMLERLRDGGLDIVVGSRYAAGGETGDWDPARLSLSRLATRLARLATDAELKDPMSGFFMIRRESFMAAVRNLSSVGFKILLDIFASSPKPLNFAEIPYRFRSRHAGESKLDSGAMWEYAMLLLDKTAGRFVPVRFLSFSLIGGFGVFVHMSVLAFALRALDLPFDWAQTIATVVAMSANFYLNNMLTYRDLRLSGLRMVRGLVSFYGVCSLGAVANVGIANWAFAQDARWWLAGLAGVLVSAVWNYAVTSLFTWRRV
jgi:dolichol-phosphate mannosyltransferase